MLQVSQTIPLLRIFDVAKAHAFYVDFLGFKVDWEHRFDANAPLYEQISRAGCVLHLTEHHVRQPPALQSGHRLNHKRSMMVPVPSPPPQHIDIKP